MKLKKAFVKEEMKKWLDDIDSMCEIAKTESQLAHSAYVIGVSKEWSFLPRTTPGIQCYLQEIEDAILHKLLPAKTGQPFIDDNLRNIMALAGWVRYRQTNHHDGFGVC
eukprot:sb/3477363/